MNKARVAVITLNETRDRFRGIRMPLVMEELQSLRWIEGFADVLFSEIVLDQPGAEGAVKQVHGFDPDLLVVHIPVWTEPVLSVKLARYFKDIPLVLLGNRRPETSSMVGLFGAGGALDQVGHDHIRIFDQHDREDQNRLKDYAAAALTIRALQGQTYGLFGGRSLGMITANADPSQWMKKFGVDIEHFDQLQIVNEAEQVSPVKVEEYKRWLEENTQRIQYGDNFDEIALEKQIRSYLATKKIAYEKRLDFIGVKCQPEMCDLYTTQCLSHMFSNSSMDVDGKKETLVHACEADSDGALTMQILKILSGGQAAALLDMRWQNPETGVWALANCGALAVDFGSTPDDPVGIAALEVVSHIIGKAPSCGLPMMAAPGKVTMARLCRKDGNYFMFILEGDIQAMPQSALKDTTACFPQAYIKMATDPVFYRDFGSNHVHMVKGDWIGALAAYCELAQIDYKIWKEE